MFFGTLAILFVGNGIEAARAKPDIRDLSGLLEQQRDKLDLPAVAAVVVHDGRIVAQGVAGVRKLGDPTPAARGDRWHLGSCTKAITATMIGVLVERGELAWDMKVGDVFSDLSEVMQTEYRDVTIEMLLAHRGGIRHELDVFGLWPVLWQRKGTPVEERRLMTRAMLAQRPEVQPGEYFYSNCGYGIAGHMAETVTGVPWEELVRKYVFDPLGMASAGFGVPWEGLPPSDPWPHERDGTPIPPGPMADNPPSIGPGGTVHASIEDWAKFVADHLKGARGEDGVLLKASTYRLLQRSRQERDADTAYALGWIVTTREWAKPNRGSGTGRCLHHAGSNNSWYSLVWIAPERDFAVLCTTNVGGEGLFPKIDAVMWSVIQDYGRFASE